MYGKQLLLVFCHRQYILLAGGIAGSLLSLVAWLPNLSIIGTIWLSQSATWLDRVAILWSLYGSLTTHYTLLATTYIVAICVLFGVQVAVLAFYVTKTRDRQSSIKTTETLSFFGILAGSLGIGCAACGSVILTAVLSLVGASGLLLYLPLRGGEFGILGVIFLLVSIFVVLKKIAAPSLCSIS